MSFKAVEEKVVAATAASAISAGALAPLVIWLFSLMGLEIPESAAQPVAMIVLTAFAAIGAFVGGYAKKSATSSVSIGYLPGPPPDLEPPQVPYQDDEGSGLSL